jgi:uncharacterized protein involved in exopolysaccharide biosynthesis
MLRYSRTILAWALLAAAAVTAYTLIRPRVYTAVSSFVPQVRRANQGTISTLAAQLGVLLPGAEASQGPAFYADLATSRELLGRLVEEPFTYPGDGGNTTMTLVDWYHAKGRSAPERRAYAIDKLREDLTATTVAKTGVVRLEVTLRNAALAAQVNQRLLDLLNDFNLRSRQTQAGQERRFVERRLEEVRADLRAAEDRLAAFMRQNREYTTSPELRFQYDRLSREVSIQQQLFVTLAQSYEQAKIDEVRDTPVISVVEQPEVPARPDRRFLALKTIVALVAGALVGLLGAMGREFIRRARAREARAYDHFQEERRRVGKQWRGHLAPLSRVFGAARSNDG